LILSYNEEIEQILAKAQEAILEEVGIEKDIFEDSVI